MDFNAFEVVGKPVRRVSEGVDDAVSYLQHGLFKAAFGEDAGIAKHATDGHMQAAKQALEHHDTREAKHQLERELYFSSTINELAGSTNEVSARAGLRSIAKGDFTDTVKWEIESACFRAMPDDSDDSRHRLFSEVVNDFAEQKSRDLMGTFNLVMQAQRKVTDDCRLNSPDLKRDSFRLAILELGMAGSEIKEFSDCGGAAIFIKDANKEIVRAGQLGADTSKIEEFSEFLRRMLPATAKCR